ncbi:MAG: slipin family protein [Bacteroidota bacterium]
MQRVTIYPNLVGIVLRDGQYQRLLSTGKHWLKWGEQLRLYNRTQPVTMPFDLGILLEDEAFEQEAQVVDVKDNEKCLHYQNGNFHNVLPAGRYAFWNSVIEHRFEHYNTDELESIQSLSKRLLKTSALLRHRWEFIVENHERGLLFVDGEFRQELGPGYHYFWRNGQSLTMLKTDLRVQQLEISGQEILTRDKAALRINFLAQYQVTDIRKALLENRDSRQQLYLKLQLALREYVGTRSLDELLANKEQVEVQVLDQVKEQANQLGLKLYSAGIRDIILPGEVKDIMNQVLIAEKTAQANTILRREETAATRTLLNSAKLMEENPMLLRLKEMEYLERIADKVNSLSLSGGGQVLDQLRDIFAAKS